MPTLDPEAVDLAELARALRDACGQPLEGAVVGRTVLRDAAVQRLGCSQLEAERLVDTMIGRGFVVQQRAPDGSVRWLVEPGGSHPASG